MQKTNKQDTRLAAAEALVAELAPSAAATAGAGGNDEEIDDEQQKHKQRALLSYALRRLVRGLASPRGAARQGFATALSGVLLAASGEGGPSSSLARGVLDTIDAEFPNPSSSTSAAENHNQNTSNSGSNNARDASLGRVFALAAVARSGAYLGDDELSSRVAEALSEIALRGKSYSREAAAAALSGVAGLLSPQGLASAASSSSSGALAAIFNGRDEGKEEEGMEEKEGKEKGGWAPLASSPVSSSPEAALIALRLWPRLPRDFDCSRCAFLPREKDAPRPLAGFFDEPSADV